MRRLTGWEKSKRGCCYCTEAIQRRVNTGNGMTIEKTVACQHNECPYHELDNCRSFRQYLLSQEKATAKLKNMLIMSKR